MEIQRTAYLEYIRKFLSKSVIKILTGMRRVGKSTIMVQLKQSLIADGIPENQIIHINLELFGNAYLTESSSLYSEIKSRITDGTKPYYILIDEIQEVKEWERVVQSLLAENVGDIVLTGSNAHLLSSELATYLTGRYIEIPIYSLSFTEFIEFQVHTGQSVTSMEQFRQFIQYGGLPGIHQFDLDDQFLLPYLNGVLDTLVLRDIVERYKIRDVTVLQRVLNFCMDSTGSLISIKKIGDFFKSQGVKISYETVSQYLQYLCDARILIAVARYDIQGKRKLEYLDKYYLTDLGLRYARMGYSPKQLPGTLETVVFHELIRRGWSVSVGVMAGTEIDFVANKRDERMYIQVAAYLFEESTYEREFGNLEAIKDSYPKWVLSLDDISVGGRNGIRWMNIRDWLSEKW